MSSADNSYESSNFDASVYLFIAFRPELLSDFGTELNHIGVSGDDGVEISFELSFVEGGFLVVVEGTELLKNFVVICLGYRHLNFYFFNILRIEFKNAYLSYTLRLQVGKYFELQSY